MHNKVERLHLMLWVSLSLMMIGTVLFVFPFLYDTSVTDKNKKIQLRMPVNLCDVFTLLVVNMSRN